MELYDVVTKLIGPVRPVGETHEDERRLENLKALTELTDQLLTDIDEIAADNKNRPEYSLTRAFNFCNKFLDKIGIQKDGATHCMCAACADGTIHASDCSVHNDPAMRNVACDCGVAPNASFSRELKRSFGESAGSDS